MALAHRHVRPADIRKGDTVLVLTGKDAGKSGTVERVVRAGVPGRGAPSRGDTVVVQGVNMAQRHTKPRPRQGRTERSPRIQQGGIVEKPMPIQVSNVMVVCPECSQPTRIRHGRVGDDSVRLCARCGSPLTKTAKP
uniref:Large ribosomal subunit protein uL24 n=1 Tax=uncultured Chloroflexi bacterium Rifle_16ft_4_minimus_899 TaxID=1665081 RepID=A0A0H4TDF3_9CHLR|nr:50S ribosomal protein L24, large subunit ribosomal protein L24 [uncultured Chloroflexi bacterium Rifle_16ft_4_minimus_899]